MRTNTGLWWLLAAFFLLVAIIYTTWNILANPQEFWPNRIEWVGTVALRASSGLMSSMIAFYIGRVLKSQRGELPEDTLTADIDDGDPEMGEFSPWSWWPIVLAASAAIAVDRSGCGQLARARSVSRSS